MDICKTWDIEMKELYRGLDDIHWEMNIGALTVNRGNLGDLKKNLLW